MNVIREIVWMVILAFVLKGTRCEIDRSKICDQSLLASFRLQGVPYPARQEPLLICNRIENNCCTLIDELQIVKYWNEFSMLKVRKFVSAYLRIYESIFEFQKTISMIDYRNVLVHITDRSLLRYRENICSMIEGVDTDREFIPEAEYARNYDKVVKAELKKPEGPTVEEEILSAMGGDSEKKKRALKNILLLKRRLRKTVRNAARRMKQLIGSQNEELVENSRKLLLSYSKDSQKEAHESLLSFLRESHANLGTLNNKNTEEAGAFVARGRQFFDQRPQVLSSNAKKISSFLHKLDSHLKVSERTFSRLVRSQKSMELSDSAISRQLKAARSTSVPVFLSRSLSDYLVQRDTPDFEPLETSVVQCRNVQRSFLKHSLLINTVKFRFCYKTYQNLQIINTIKLADILESVRSALTDLMSVKKSLYCAICDWQQQKFFDTEKGLIYMAPEFCFDLIRTHQDYIKFNNMLFVEYADEIMQYIRCLITGPYELDLPFKTRLEKQKLRMVFFKRCFSHLYSNQFMRYCSFICSKFNFNGVHEFIEGSAKEIYMLYYEILEFMRQNNIKFDKKAIITSEYLASIPSAFYDSHREALKAAESGKSRSLSKGGNSPAEGQRIEDLKKETYDIHSAQKSQADSEKKAVVQVKNKTGTDSEPIFNRIKRLVVIKNMQPVFLNKGQGLNPFMLDVGTTFDVDVNHFIDLHFNKIRGETSIHRDVLKNYFATNGAEIFSFQNDVNIRFNPNITAGAQESPEEGQPPQILNPPTPEDKVRERSDHEFNTFF